MSGALTAGVIGIGAGLAVAAPVGPIGLLCIQRSIAHGRAAGLATGLGAATADAAYGLLVAFGALAAGALEGVETPLRVGGGLLLLALGAATARRFFAAPADPAAAAAAPTGWSARPLGAFLSSLALTLSNPATILSFLALMASLGLHAAADAAAPFALVLGVFAGSALWWLFLTHLALLARGRVTPTRLRWLDLVSGGALALFGLLTLAQAAGEAGRA